MNLKREPVFPVIFDDRIVINVSGQIFETREETLARFPNSLLGSHGKRHNYYIPEFNEYFFNRNRTAFEAILYYYQSHGKLRRPNEVPIKVFKQEIEFFELGDDILHAMLNLDMRGHTLQAFRKHFGSHYKQLLQLGMEIWCP
ncbi:Potassium voltage-gated channel subfamily A member 1 [Exaiptasia diaphana]|nr:Potassium voltage-gated channel subfamily A member 1 [Exaiptasia diaphana]